MREFLAFHHVNIGGDPGQSNREAASKLREMGLQVDEEELVFARNGSIFREREEIPHHRNLTQPVRWQDVTIQVFDPDGKPLRNRQEKRLITQKLPGNLDFRYRLASTEAERALWLALARVKSSYGDKVWPKLPGKTFKVYRALTLQGISGEQAENLCNSIKAVSRDLVNDENYLHWLLSQIDEAQAANNLTQFVTNQLDQMKEWIENLTPESKEPEEEQEQDQDSEDLLDQQETGSVEEFGLFQDQLTEDETADLEIFQQIDRTDHLEETTEEELEDEDKRTFSDKSDYIPMLLTSWVKKPRMPQSEEQIPVWNLTLGYQGQPEVWTHQLVGNYKDVLRFRKTLPGAHTTLVWGDEQGRRTVKPGKEIPATKLLAFKRLVTPHGVCPFCKAGYLTNVLVHAKVVHGIGPDKPEYNQIKVEMKPVMVRRIHKGQGENRPSWTIHCECGHQDSHPVPVDSNLMEIPDGFPLDWDHIFDLANTPDHYRTKVSNPEGDGKLKAGQVKTILAGNPSQFQNAIHKAVKNHTCPKCGCTGLMKFESFGYEGRTGWVPEFRFVLDKTPVEFKPTLNDQNLIIDEGNNLGRYAENFENTWVILPENDWLMNHPRVQAFEQRLRDILDSNLSDNLKLIPNLDGENVFKVRGMIHSEFAPDWPAVSYLQAVLRDLQRKQTIDRALLKPAGVIRNDILPRLALMNHANFFNLKAGACQQLFNPRNSQEEKDLGWALLVAMEEELNATVLRQGQEVTPGFKGLQEFIKTCNFTAFREIEQRIAAAQLTVTEQFQLRLLIPEQRKALMNVAAPTQQRQEWKTFLASSKPDTEQVRNIMYGAQLYGDQELAIQARDVLRQSLI